MPPKRGHARNASSASASSQATTNHIRLPSPPTTSSLISSSSPPASSPQIQEQVMTLMGRPKTFSGPAKLALLPVIAMVVSAALYTGASSLVEMQQLKVVTKAPKLWRQAVPILTRVFVLYAQWFLGLDAINTFAVTLHARLPFYYLLYLFYGISLQTITISALIDATSCAVAFYILDRRRPANYASREAAKSTEKAAVYDLSNVVVLTGLATAIFGTALFILSATKLPLWMITSFDSIVTVERPHTFHLGQFLALALPLGWSLREFVFGPATIIDSKDPKKFTASISNRTEILSVLTYVETFVRTVTAVEGASVAGAAFWTTVWYLLIRVVGAALVKVGEAAEPVEVEVEVESDEDATGSLETRDSTVVPEKLTRGKRGSTKVST